MVSKMPSIEEELMYAPSCREVSFFSEISDSSVTAFRIMSQHFPKAWGFRWGTKENALTAMLHGLPESEKENVYRQLAKRNCSQLRNMMSRVEHLDIMDGLLTVGGEKGKRIISEAFQCVGLPPHVTFKGDLAFLDIKDKVPMSWLVREAPAAFNIHPGPPERRGAGLYVPSLLAGDRQYGITVHFMSEKLDAGPIIAVRRFDIPKGSTRTQLSYLAAQHSLVMFEDLILHMKFTKSLSDIHIPCHYLWQGTETTRKMVRMMIKETRMKYGEHGHPVLM